MNIWVCPSDGDNSEAFRTGGPYGTGLFNDAQGTPIYECFDGISYIYIGWGFMNDTEVTAGIDLITDLLSGDISPDEDFTTEATSILPNHTFYRLREGIERFFISDINNPAASATAQSQLPVQWDWLGTTASSYNHVPGGSNVLYMDGHVTFVKYPGEFPVTAAFAGVTGAIASL
ncbi:MAG: hypothetical protein K1Y02_13725 [Candidatus Hydrogenedentes bacterium]|nr:hypothetical protein [Candidatus Hydrogenedentota bacterium]